MKINNNTGTAAQKISDLLSPRFSGKDYALTAVIQDGGYRVGIAQDNSPGYWPTKIILDDPNYHTVSDWVRQANTILWPARTEKESFEIVLRSMRKP